MCQRIGIGQFIDHADFQRGGAAQNVLGLGGVLHPGQLHHHAIHALLLDHRLGHAELVDAVAQGGDVLLQREFLHALLGYRFEFGGQREFIGSVGRREQQVAKSIRQLGLCGIALVAGAEMHDHRLPLFGNAAVADFFAAQIGAEIVLITAGGLVECRRHVHFQQEIHPAAQIETQIHRQGIDG